MRQPPILIDTKIIHEISDKNMKNKNKYKKSIICQKKEERQKHRIVRINQNKLGRVYNL